MSSALKKFSFAIILSFLFLVVPTTVQAATPPQPLTPSNYKAPENADYAVTNLMHAASCQLTGMSAVSKCIGLTSKNGTVKAYLYDRSPNSAVASINSALATVYTTPPTSTTEYIADVASGFGFERANAQVLGSGSSVVAPVLALWQVVRNFVYILFILVFVIVGFMIMFRQKLSGQAVVSVETALPRLIIGLILVTFSYFISSLLIDFSFFGVQLVAQIFAQSSTGVTNVFGDADSIQRLANESNIFWLFISTTRPVANFLDVQNATAGLASSISGGAVGNNAITTTISTIAFSVIGFLVAGPIGGAVGLGAAQADNIIAMLIPLILIIALVVQFIRLLFDLINAYITMLVLTVFSPLIILSSSIPGRGGGMGFWYLGILGNALVFPAVFGAMMFAGVILGVTDQNLFTQTPPLFGGLNPSLVRILIAYGILLGLPSIPGEVRKAVGVKDLGALAQEARAGFRRGSAPVSATIGAIPGVGGPLRAALGFMGI